MNRLLGAGCESLNAPKSTVLAIGYTEKIPPNQIKSAFLAVNWGKMLKNFRAIKVMRVLTI
jgi:hypothetical protein